MQMTQLPTKTLSLDIYLSPKARAFLIARSGSEPQVCSQQAGR